LDGALTVADGSVKRTGGEYDLKLADSMRQHLGATKLFFDLRRSFKHASSEKKGTEPEKQEHRCEENNHTNRCVAYKPQRCYSPSERCKRTCNRFDKVNYIDSAAKNCPIVLRRKYRNACSEKGDYNQEANQRQHRS
jgi:hypothetical protein